MLSLGIIVDDLDFSEKSYCITESAKKCVDLDVIVYCLEHRQIAFKPHFSVMQSSELFAHNGPVIATSIETYLWVKRLHAPKKAFYVWDLEWLRHNSFAYRELLGSYPVSEEKLREIYCDDEVKLILRCEDHAKLAKNAFNLVDVPVVERFNIQEIATLLV